MKTIIRLSIVALIILAGFITVSCTDGQNLGTGGAGNLNIIEIPLKYNGKYIAVITTIGSSNYSFYQTGRIKISNGKIKAPLYKSDNEKYNSTGTGTVTATIYDNTTIATSITTNTFTEVKFYDGSAVVYWPAEE